MSIISSNAETIRSPELIPSQVRENSTVFVKLVEEYYCFLNSQNASDALSSITLNRNIDTVSQDYLTSIVFEIAKSFPVTVDVQDLYRKIIQYYRIRGTGDSITTFFKLFFNEIVEVYYPKVDLLRVSDGKWDSTTNTWENTDGFISADKRIQDSKIYQEFSYLIYTSTDYAKWALPLNKLAHPAGLKFFSEVALYLSVTGQVNSWLDTRSGGNTWEDTLIPNFHSPLTQAGIFDIILAIISSNDSWYLETLHSSYDSLKFVDTIPNGQYANISPWNGNIFRLYDINTFNFNNVSSTVIIS